MTPGKTFAIKLTGIAPMLTHNGLLADPSYEYTKALKLISGRRDKSDDDREQMAHHEFQGGLYFVDGVGPVIPSGNIEAAVKAAGSTVGKAGKTITAVFFVNEEFVPLTYAGPRTREELWANPIFRDRRTAVVQRARIVRTRPRFTQWSLEFTATLLPCKLGGDDLRRFFEHAGYYVGLGDYRPKFGRFEVESFEEVGAKKGKKAA